MDLRFLNLLLLTVVFVVQGHSPLHLKQLPRCSEHDTLKKIEKIADPFDYKRYFICENDILTLKTCRKGEIFDSYLSSCTDLEQNNVKKLSEGKVIGNSKDLQINSYQVQNVFNSEISSETETKTTSLPFVCPSKWSHSYPDETSCRKYYYCEDGIPKSYFCPTYLLFDVKSAKCQFFLYATCIETLRTTTPSPPTCTSGETKDIPFPNDCKQYYHCSNGVVEVKKCGWFESFDENQLKCRFFFFASCSQTSDTYTVGNVENNYNYQNKHGFVGSDSLKRKSIRYLRSLRYFREGNFVGVNDQPQCNENDVFKRRFPGDCKKFYHCYHGTLNIYKCFFIFNFDPVTESCVWFWKADCHYTPVKTTVQTSLATSLSTAVTPYLSTTPSVSPASTNLTPLSSTLLSVSTYPTTYVSTGSTVASNSSSSQAPSTIIISTNSVSSSQTSVSSESSPTKLTSHTLTTLNSVSSSSSLKKDTETSKESQNNYIKSKILSTTNKDNYECQPAGIYDTIYPYNCNKYYHCNNGILTIERCSLFKDFDPIQLKCRWFILVDCRARPITSTPAPLTTSSSPIVSSTSAIYTSPLISSSAVYTTSTAAPLTSSSSLTTTTTIEYTTSHRPFISTTTAHHSKPTHHKKRKTKRHHKATTRRKHPRKTHKTTTESS